MKNLSLNKWITVLGVILLLIFTFFRENLALEINAFITAEETNRAYSYWFSSCFEGLSITELTKWKWIITLFFTVVMTIVTILSLHQWFKNIKYTKLTMLLYLTLIAIVCLAATIAYLMNSFSSIYFILRKVLGFLQSPVPFFALFVLFYIEKSNSQN